MPPGKSKCLFRKNDQNHEIKKYQLKAETVKQKYLLRQIDFDLAKRMLSGSESSKSLREFIL